MKYYIVVGEPSGDMYGAELMTHIQQLDDKATFRFWGGNKMESVGGEQVCHIKERSFMGIWEVVANLFKIKRNFKYFKKDIIANKPDALILIDYPGFNLRIAPIAKKLDIPIHYFIAPKVWAWDSKRTKKIKAFVDYLYCILPFELEFFAKHKIKPDYVGNPIMDLMQKHEHDANVLNDLQNGKPVIALLPGSRKMELKNMLPVMTTVTPHFPNYRFIIAASDAFDDALLQTITKDYPVEVIKGKTYEILSVAKAALVTSGTATLETALWNVPQVVCYKFSKISYLIVKSLIKIKYISLVNLILNKALVTELIQDELEPKKLKKALKNILEGEKRKEILNGYAALRIRVGNSGATLKTAKLIYDRTNTDKLI
jgi:lipid-A-disaccharide synthase